MKKLWLLVIVLILSACGSTGDAEDSLYECYGISSNNDTVSEEYYLMTVDKKDKDTIKKMEMIVNYFYNFKSSDDAILSYKLDRQMLFKDIKGVDYKHNFGRYGSQEKLTLDYINSDLEVLAEKGLITVDEGKPTYISYQQTVEGFSDLQCQKVEDNKFTLREGLKGSFDLTEDTNAHRSDIFEGVVQGEILKTKCTYATEIPEYNSVHDFEYESGTNVVVYQNNYDVYHFGQGHTAADVRAWADDFLSKVKEIDGVEFEYKVDEENSIYMTQLTIDYLVADMEKLAEVEIVDRLQNGDAPAYIDYQLTLDYYNSTQGWVCEPVE